MARKVLPSKKVAAAIAIRFGKDIPHRPGDTVQLTEFVTMSNKVMGNSRRTVLVGPPNSLKAFLETC